MIFEKYSLKLRLEDKDIDFLNSYIRYGGGELELVPWYSVRADKKYRLYEIMFDGTLSLDDLEKKAEVIKENFKLEGVRVYFKNNSDIYTLLENKGFVRYQDNDFVEFDHRKKFVALKVQPFADTHVLETVILDDKASIDYAFKLIDRVIEILSKKGEAINEKEDK